MYTGIVQGLEKVVDIRQGNGFITIIVSNENQFFRMSLLAPVLRSNGVCLTVTTIDQKLNQIHFDISNVTLALTTLKSLQVGDEVNVERSAKVGAENGGHNLYGHIEGTAIIKNLEYRVKPTISTFRSRMAISNTFSERVYWSERLQPDHQSRRSRQ